jgi:hypothetical protein
MKNELIAIDDSAFEGCSSLKSITIPKKVQGIGDRAFYGCSLLGSITIKAQDLKIVGDDAFENIYKYAVFKLSVKKQYKEGIKNKITSVGETFTDKKGLIYVIDSLNNETVWVTGITDEAAAKKSLTIPASVTYKGISYKVTSVADNAVKGRTKLTKVILGKNLTNIGSSAFEGCSAVKTVTIPAKVKTIGAKAFKDCAALKTVTIKAADLVSIGLAAFEAINSSATVKLSVKKNLKEKIRALLTREVGIYNYIKVV